MEGLLRSFFCGAFVIITLLTSGCGDETEKDVPKVEQSLRYSGETYKMLENIAKKYFNNNDVTAQKWIKTQLQAQYEIESIVPDIPIGIFSKIKNVSAEKKSDRFCRTIAHGKSPDGRIQKSRTASYFW